MEEQKLVFLAEDDPHHTRLYTKALNGYKVVPFESAEGVLEHMQKNQTVPDMLITDNSMKGTIKGYDLAKAIRMVHPNLPIRLQTGDSGDYTELRKAGIDVFYKPTDIMKFMIYARTRLGKIPRKSILFADDQSEAHDLISESLTHRYPTLHYFNGLDAQKRLHQPSESLNLEMAILDANMPGVHGEALAVDTRIKHPKLPIVLYTGDDLSHYRFLEKMDIKLINKQWGNATELCDYVDGVLK